MSFKLDLHTHSGASPDGGISLAQYKKALSSGQIDYVAITDHNRIDVAQTLQNELGDRIIVGEEIMTSAGELVGLFLNKLVPPGLTPQKTIEHIKKQGGLVYVPHPFETVRKGLHPSALEKIADQIDILEICNGRAFLQNRSKQAVVWARINHIAGASSSDAHGFHGLGRTYTIVAKKPTKKNLVDLVNLGTPTTDRPALRALLYPKYHRLRKKISRKS